MSKNIDEQVVKLTFDNKDFERPAKQSTNTLGRLKDATVDVTNSISGGLSQAISRLNFGDLLKVGGLAGGLVLLKNGINDLAAPIKNVGDLALNTINNTLNKALEQIKTGGWSRAQKIDNAKFMLKGLGLDEETFMQAADYAVSGTAYTLDAAANAAAQFGASGYKNQEQLNYMLRSISGVAAMTNRDFEEISYLWTQMAGLGRVTGMTLTSLSMKGINAAKTLGDAIGKTESEVRDMVSKGQIDFDTFAKAMDDAFGEHAKDANATFNGATANIRAALSKLGADFAAVILADKNFNASLNSIRETINLIRNATKPIAETSWVDTFHNLSDALHNLVLDAQSLLTNSNRHISGKTILNVLAEDAQWLLDIANKVAKVLTEVLNNNFARFDFGKIGKGLAGVADSVSTVVKEVFGVFERSFDLWTIVTKIKNVVIDFIEGINSGLTLTGMQFSEIRLYFSQLIKLGKSLWKTFKETFNLDKFNTADVVKNIVKQITTLLNKLTLSDKTIDNLTKAFKGILDVVVLIYDAASTLIAFIWPIVLDIIPELIDGIAQISGWIGTLATDVVKFVENSEIIQTVWTNVKEVIQTLIDMAGKIGKSFFELFFGGEGGEGKKFFERVGEFIGELEIIIGDAAKSLDLEGIDFTPIKEFFTNLFTLGFEKFNNVKLSLENGKNQIGSISDILGVVVVLFNNIGEFVSKIVDMAIKEKGSASLIGKPIFDVVSAFREGIDGMSETELSAMENIFLKICDVLMILIVAIATVVTTFAAGTGLKGFAKKIENISISIGDTIGFLVETFTGKTWKSLATVLGRNRQFINADNISDLVSAIAKVIASIALLVAVVKVLDVNASDVGSIAAIMGITMGIITACLLALSIISAKMGLLTNKTTKLETMFERNGKQKSNTLLNKLATGFGFADLSIIGVQSPFGQIARALLMVAGGIALISLSIAALRLGMGGPDGYKKMQDAAGLLMKVVITLSLLLGAIAYLSNRLSGGAEFKGNIESSMLSIAGSIAIIGVAMNLISLSLISVSLFKTEKIASAALIMGLLVGILSAIFGLIGGLVTDPKASIAIGVTGIAVLLAFIGVAAALMSIAGACLMLSAIDVNKLEKVKKLMIPLTSIILGITAGVGLIIGIISAINPAAGAIAAVGLVAFGFALIETAAAALLLAGAIGIAMSASEKLAKSVGELWATISNLFGILSADTVSEEQLSTFKDNFANVAVSVFQGWSKGIMEGIHYISEHYEEYAEDIRGILETIITSFPKLVAELNGNGENGKGIGSLILDMLFPNRAGSFGELLGRLEPFWNETVLPAIDSFLNLITPQLNDIIRRLCDTIVVFSVTNAPIIASAAVETFLIWVTSFNDAIERDKEQIKEVVSNLLNTLGDLAIDIVSGAEIWSKLVAVGGYIIEGIKNGIIDALNGVPFISTLTSIGTTIFNTVCDSLGIESPSKVMKQVGDFVMQGLGLGIENGKGGLNTTLDGLVETFTGFGDNISGIFDKFDFKITPELDTSLIDGGLSGLKDTIGNFDMTNIGSIMNTRDKMNAMPNVNDLLDATNAKMSDILGTVYSIDQSKLNTQPINIDVALEGDTGKFFKAMVKENHRYTLANGASAF